MPSPVLQPGLAHRFDYRVPPERTVPNLYPEASELRPMPEVFATGFLVGLLEWTCVQLLVPHLRWPQEQTVGTSIAISHEAAMPPGFIVTSIAELTGVHGRRLEFKVEAHDELDLIARGTHERVIIDTPRFSAKVADKAARLTR